MRSLEDDLAGGILLGGHLPSAESTGVAAVAAAGLNAGPVLQLDLVAILKSNASNSNIEILCTVISRQIELSARRSCTLTLDSDGSIQIVYVILLLPVLFTVSSKLPLVTQRGTLSVVHLMLTVQVNSDLVLS